MSRSPRFTSLALFTGFVACFSACGRSDLFSVRHRGSGGNGSIAGDGGRDGGGAVSGRDAGGDTAAPTGVGGSAMGSGAGALGGRGGAGDALGGRGGMPGGRGGGNDGGRGGNASCASHIEICDNGTDDNCNGLVDCRDPGCFGDRHCAPPGQEICNNAIDDDGDGLVDCADPDCVGSPACRPGMGAEVCDNGIDDNSDGLVDCADPQCTTFSGCLMLRCSPDLDFGTIAPHGARVTRAVDTRGATRGYATCVPSGGVGRVGRFALDTPADVRLDFAQGPTSAHAIGVYRAGASQVCDRNPVDCVNAMDHASAARTFNALPAGLYWIIVESYPGLPGPTMVTLSTGSVATPEICNNGIDDDGNGLVDCADLVCRNNPACAGRECVPDVEIGTLIVDGASRSTTANLRVATDDYGSTCSAGVPGGDVAISFTLAEPAGLEVQFQQAGRSIFALYKMPAPGLACDADQLSCGFEDAAANAVAFVGLPAGRYVFIVKAQSVAQAGTINLRFSAFSGRHVEICGNGIDDDGNGLADCADPACFGLVGCPPPACMVDQDLGLFSWGTRRTLTIDTRGGGTLWPTSCSRGTGKERVVKLTLTQPMSLAHNCTDGGSHVLALSRQVHPLDACDENEIVCVDPAVLPFGCNYSLPDLQPGQYDLVVQAFQSGGEGLISLTLTGIQAVIREICDNGIDDDGDGFIDCADRKCVTQPTCAKFACRADQSVGLLALDGTPRTVVLQTAMAGDDQQATSCAAARGGQDAVVDFQLPALADLTLEWAQVGDHDFALYENEGARLACDAGTQRACVASLGTPTGVNVFSALPAGRYHLVVDADRPGKEGGAVVQISAVATPMP